MTYTVGKLITNAYYVSKVVARDFQTVQGSQMQDGLDMLNDILSETVVENDMIPYFSDYTFNAIQGREKYFVPNLIELDTLVFFIDGVRYPMTQIQRKQYYGTARADNIQSLPFTYHVERSVGGATINLYFLPNTNYPMEAWGLFALQQVAINQDLQNSLANVGLGAALITGAGTLAPQQLVINGVDMAGAYASTILLVQGINAQTINTGVSAVYTLNNLMLTSRSTITVSTLGVGNIANTVTFYNFSTLNGQYSESVFPMQLDRFYISYLKYKLAVRICTEFGYMVPDGVQKQLLTLQQEISKRSQQLDLKATIISTLGSSTSLNYAAINLSNGWTI